MPNAKVCPMCHMPGINIRAYFAQPASKPFFNLSGFHFHQKAIIGSFLSSNCNFPVKTSNYRILMGT